MQAEVSSTAMMSNEQMTTALGGEFDDNYLRTTTHDDELPATVPHMNDHPTAVNGNTCSPLFSPTDSEAFDSGGRMGEMRTKLGDIKNWTVAKLKTTKQAVFEHFGRSERTIDPVLEQKIAVLRQQQRTYAHLLTSTRGLTFHVRQTALMQAQMSNAMDALAKTELHAAEILGKNARTQRCITDAAGELLAALDHFNDELHTMVSEVIEDTIVTIRRLDHTRLEYDANRNELLRLQVAAQSGDDNKAKEVQVAQEATNEFERTYEQLKEDVQVKMQFLQDNRVKTMTRELDLLYQATIAFYAGNSTQLQGILQQFKVHPPTEQARGYTGDAYRPIYSFFEK